MASFHIDPRTGEPSLCSAVVGNCPFGIGSAAHMPTAKKARAAYEQVMAPFALPKPLRKLPGDSLR